MPKIPPNLSLNLQRLELEGPAGTKLDLAKVNQHLAGCPMVHGSRSASLLAFTDIAGPNRNQLVPLGRLLESGTVPFCGEMGNGLMTRGANQKYLSAVASDEVSEALHYATAVNSEPWSVEREERSLVETRSELALLEKQPAGEKGFIADTLDLMRNRVRASEMRLAQWARMSPAEQTLVQANMPIIYGLRTGPRSEGVTSFNSNRREFGIPQVRPQDIGVIMTDSRFVGEVERLLQGNPELRHVSVVGLEDLGRQAGGDLAAGHRRVETQPPQVGKPPARGQAWVDVFASSQENVQAFEQALASSGRPVVHFPPSARGDMNAYKYTAFLEGKDRPLTVFEYYKNPHADSDQQAFNNNINVIRQHIKSLGNRVVEGRDYIFSVKKDIDKYKATAGEGRTRHYQTYDSIMSNLDVRRKVHGMLKETIAAEPKIRVYLAKKLPSAAPSPGNQRPENKLIMVNINKREPQGKWNPREYRHTTPDDAHMRGLIDQVYAAQKGIAGKDKLDIAFVGSKFTAQEQTNWRDYGASKGVNVHFFNDMVDDGLDRNQQRAALYALTERYKGTVYLGHQSGVNEDAQILPRTNVYSLSEFLGLGQVGISRVEARPQLDTVRTSDLGMAKGASSSGNFYSLRNSEFLTTEGILAAVQIKANLTSKKHRPLDALWEDLTRQNPDMMKPENRTGATDKLLKTILKEAGQVTEDMTDDMISRKIGEQALLDYKNAVDVIVGRMQSGHSRPSPAFTQYFTNAMEQELTRHDASDPITRHGEKLESHNAGIPPYTLGGNQRAHRRLDNEEGYLTALGTPWAAAASAPLPPTLNAPQAASASEIQLARLDEAGSVALALQEGARRAAALPAWERPEREPPALLDYLDRLSRLDGDTLRQVLERTGLHLVANGPQASARILGALGQTLERGEIAQDDMLRLLRDYASDTRHRAMPQLLRRVAEHSDTPDTARSLLAILRSEHEPGLRPGYAGLLVRLREMCDTPDFVTRLSETAARYAIQLVQDGPQARYADSGQLLERADALATLRERDVLAPRHAPQSLLYGAVHELKDKARHARALEKTGELEGAASRIGGLLDRLVEVMQPQEREAVVDKLLRSSRLGDATRAEFASRQVQRHDGMAQSPPYVEQLQRWLDKTGRWVEPGAPAVARAGTAGATTPLRAPAARLPAPTTAELETIRDLSQASFGAAGRAFAVLGVQDAERRLTPRVLDEFNVHSVNELAARLGMMALDLGADTTATPAARLLVREKVVDALQRALEAAPEERRDTLEALLAPQKRQLKADTEALYPSSRPPAVEEASVMWQLLGAWGRHANDTNIALLEQNEAKRKAQRQAADEARQALNYAESSRRLAERRQADEAQRLQRAVDLDAYLAERAARHAVAPEPVVPPAAAAPVPDRPVGPNEFHHERVVDDTPLGNHMRGASAPVATARAAGVSTAGVDVHQVDVGGVHQRRHAAAPPPASDAEVARVRAEALARTRAPRLDLRQVMSDWSRPSPAQQRHWNADVRTVAADISSSATASAGDVHNTTAAEVSRAQREVAAWRR